MDRLDEIVDSMLEQIYGLAPTVVLSMADARVLVNEIRRYKRYVAGLEGLLAQVKQQ